MIEGSKKTFLTGTGGVSAHTRVKLSGSTVVTAGATDVGIGVAEFTASAGEDVTVRLFNAGGTFEIVAAGAISAAAAVYAAADGEIAASGTLCLGETVEAATADADVIEILPEADLSQTPVAQLPHVADPAACASMTTDLTGVDTGTDMTAAQAAQIVADLAALKAGIDANNVAIDSILDQLATVGLQAAS